jgi:DNA-directed RNA polymerase specialized sigma24 family protein
MAYFRDCSQSEISVLTGMPLGTVKTLITRSQQKLRVAMAAGSKGDAVHNASFESLASP